MPFAYSDQSASDEPLKQDIFNNGQAGGANAQQNPEGDTPQKASIDGGQVQSGSVQQTQAQPAAQAPKVQQSYNPKNTQQTYTGIARRLALPTDRLGSARNQIQSSQQKLQDEANRYAQSAQTAQQGYQLDQETLSKALGGDKDAYAKTSQRLSQGVAPEFESFAGLGSDVPNVDYLKNSQAIYADQAGPNYSSGQRRLDAALLRMNPNYAGDVEKILTDRQALQKQSDEMRDSETQKQRDALKTAYSQSTEDIRKRLGLLGDDIVSRAKAKEAEEDTRRAGLDQTALTAAEIEKLKGKLREDLGKEDPNSDYGRARSWIDLLNTDDLAKELGGKYTTLNKDTDWHQFLSPEDIEKYNRAQGLLGTSELLTPGQSAAPDYNFDQNSAYQDILTRLVGQARAVPPELVQGMQDQALEQAVATTVPEMLNHGNVDLSNIPMSGLETLGGIFGDNQTGPLVLGTPNPPPAAPPPLKPDMGGGSSGNRPLQRQRPPKYTA